MTVPDFQRLMLPILRLASDQRQHTLAETVEKMADEFQLSENDRGQLLRSGQTRLYNRVGWATTYLKKAGVLQAMGPGRYQLTERGDEVLASNPSAIDVKFLESRFPEMSLFSKASKRGTIDDEAPAVFNTTTGSWEQRQVVHDRIRDLLEQSIPNEAIRRDALLFLAAVIENADEEDCNAWYLRDTAQGLRLMTGRLLACEIARSKIKLSIIGPITDGTRAAIAADPDSDEEFKTIPGWLILRIPLDHAAAALDLVKDGLNGFVDAAMARVKRRVSLEDHVPEAVAYIESVIGRQLPQPEPTIEDQDSERADDALDDDDGDNHREPRLRGRAPIFEHGQRSIASLMNDIENEVIALPDLQRPFVWEDTKVRDLLDSLFVGFPVGTLVLWHTSNDEEARALAGR